MKKQMIALCTIILVVISIVLWKNPFLVSSKYGTSIEQLDPTLEWKYVNQQMVAPEFAVTAYEKGEHVTIPDLLNERYGTPEGYGTYIAKWTLPQDMIAKPIAFFIPFEYGNYKLYINGDLIAQNGTVEKTKAAQKPVMTPVLISKKLYTNEVYIVMQLSNFHSKRGGFTQSIQVGEAEMMLQRHYTTVLFHFFLTGAICAVGIFSLLIGSFKRKKGTALPFALLCFTIGIRSFFGRPFNYSITIIDIPWLVAAKIESIGSLLAFFFILTLLNYVVAPKHFKWVNRFIIILFGLQLGIILLTDPKVYQYTFIIPIAVALIASFVLIVKGLLKIRYMSLTKWSHLISAILLLIAGIHDIITVYFVLERPIILQLIMALYALFGVFVMSWQYRSNIEQTMQLHRELSTLNLSLEHKIQQRTNALRVANAQLEKLAWRDALTCIANRHTFDIQIQQYFDDVYAKKQSVGLLMIDIDNFKKYNDYYGHVRGDTLLKQVVEQMQAVLPNDAVFARYGGEEFAVIVPNATNEKLKALGDLLVSTIAESRIEHAGHDLKIVTISIGGYVMTPADAFDKVEAWIHTADEALYRVKNNGKNQCLIE